MNLISRDKKFYRQVAGIAVPIALQGFITTGVNMMDTLMIGIVGETQLSAVSLANQFISIYQILCMGIGMGASVLVARYYGMGDRDSLKKTVAIMVRLCVGMAALFCLVRAILFYWDLIRVVRSPEGEISLDFKGKKPGRGAYVCPQPECLKKARKSRALERAFSTSVPPAVYEQLEEQMREENG